MKKIIYISVFCAISSLLIGQAYKVKKLDLSGVIFSEKQTKEIKLLPFSEKKEFWTPTKSDVEELEKYLPVWISKNELDVAKGILKDLKNYKRQYLGFLENGKRFIYVNAFCKSFYKNDKSWRTHFVFVMDGGSCFFQIIYDCDKKSFSRFLINGIA
ncbi:MAG: hypothetical protein HYZ10_16040 [Ignavibacteriales bacterium]|nr:hypothetical protein [Ignavibacteriales bacterium]